VRTTPHDDDENPTVEPKVPKETHIFFEKGGKDRANREDGSNALTSIRAAGYAPNTWSRRERLRLGQLELDGA
jgi:hypothetical protein